MKLNKILFAMSSLALTGMFVSCSVDDYIANKDEILKQLGEFSFQTTEDVMLDINYGPLASRALVQVYGENPLAEATENDETPKGETVFTTFLDENGRFTGEVDIPAHVDHLYFYTSSMAAPLLTDAEVKGNLVKVQSDVHPAVARVSRSIVDDEHLQVRQLTSSENGGSATNYYTIVGGWDNYGNPEDPNHLIDAGVLTSNDVHDVERYFWYVADNATDWSKPGDPTGDRLTRLRNMRVDNVNMVVQEQYEEDGVTYDVESAQVWFTFLTEYAWNENTVGYYFFDKNNPPQKASDIKNKFIILPNASKAEEPPFSSTNGDYKYMVNKAPTSTNNRVQLLYVDEATGKASRFFPPNTEIGFFLIPNGFRATGWLGTGETVDGKTYNTRANGKIATNTAPLYSDYRFNSGSVDGVGGNIKKRFVACRLTDGTVVYGCEDSKNESYDDMLFTITASPNKAIHTQEGSTLVTIPSKEDVLRFSWDYSEKYTYAFEDLWPDGGDYDLNDVIVRHSRDIKKDQFNEVVEVIDHFTFEISPTTADANAFAYQVPATHVGSYTLPEGAWFEEETSTFFLSDNVHKVNGQTLDVVRTFASPLSFKELKAEANPFIINTTIGPDCRSNGRVEIHLPKALVTSKGKQIDNEKNPAKAWYISDDGLHPYALKVTDIEFKACDPGVQIGSGSGAYPDFNDWVNSLGKDKKDWYKNK